MGGNAIKCQVGIKRISNAQSNVGVESVVFLRRIELSNQASRACIGPKRLNETERFDDGGRDSLSAGQSQRRQIERAESRPIDTALSRSSNDALTVRAFTITTTTKKTGRIRWTAL